MRDALSLSFSRFFRLHLDKWMSQCCRILIWNIALQKKMRIKAEIEGVKSVVGMSFAFKSNEMVREREKSGMENRKTLCRQQFLSKALEKSPVPSLQRHGFLRLNFQLKLKSVCRELSHRLRFHSFKEITAVALLLDYSIRKIYRAQTWYFSCSVARWASFVEMLSVRFCLRFCGGDTLLAAIPVAAKYTTNNPQPLDATFHPALWSTHDSCFSQAMLLSHVRLLNADFLSVIYAQLKLLPYLQQKRRREIVSGELKSASRNLFNLVFHVIYHL